MKWQLTTQFRNAGLTPVWPTRWRIGGWRQALADYRDLKRLVGTAFVGLRTTEKGKAIGLDDLADRELWALGPAR